MATVGSEGRFKLIHGRPKWASPFHGHGCPSLNLNGRRWRRGVDGQTDGLVDLDRMMPLGIVVIHMSRNDRIGKVLVRIYDRHDR